MRIFALAGIFVLIAFLVALHFLQLDADPPVMLAQYGQSALTDPYLYTWHARQAALFAPDQRIEYERFSPLKFTAVSAAARMVFAFAGVSRVTANVASVLLCLGGFLFWLLGLRRYWDWERVTIVALLLLANFILITYAKMPYLENGLIFLFGLTFFVFARWGHKPAGQLLTGILIVIAALCGKLFGILLFVPVSMCWVFFDRRNSIKSIALSLAGGVIALALYIGLAMKGDLHLWWQYQIDNTNLLSVSKYISNPLGPIGMFLSFGGEGGLTLFGIGTIIIATVGSIVWLLSRDLRNLAREDLPLIFAFLWLVVSLCTFFPFEYRPLRYLLVAILPALTFSVPLYEWWQGHLRLILKPLWLALPLIFVITMYLTNQIISYGANLAHAFVGFKSVLPYCIAAAFILTALLFVYRRNSSWFFPHTAGRIVIALVAVFYVATNAKDIYAALSQPRYDLKTLNREIAEAIDPSAIVTGSYAPALTIDNKLNGIFNYLGTVRADSAFFTKFHPTHILTNSTDWEALCKDYPRMKNFGSMVNPVLWSYHLAVVPVPDSSYHATLFENVVSAAQNRQLDSAIHLLDTFDHLHPHNRFAATWRINILFSSGSQTGVLMSAVNGLLSSYPEDLFISAFAAVAYDRLGRKDLSKACLDNCNRINPFARPKLQ